MFQKLFRDILKVLEAAPEIENIVRLVLREMNFLVAGKIVLY
jgi:hypothetical protein